MVIPPTDLPREDLRLKLTLEWEVKEGYGELTTIDPSAASLS